MFFPISSSFLLQNLPCSQWGNLCYLAPKILINQRSDLSLGILHLKKKNLIFLVKQVFFLYFILLNTSTTITTTTTTVIKISSDLKCVVLTFYRPVAQANQGNYIKKDLGFLY